MLSTRDLKTLDRAQHARVAQMRFAANHAVRDVVVDGGVFFLLDVLHGAVFKGPADNVGFGRGAFVFLGGLEGRVPVVEVGEFDQICEKSLVGIVCM